MKRRHTMSGYLPDSWSFLDAAAAERGFCSVGVVAAGPVDAEVVDKYRRWAFEEATVAKPYLVENMEARVNPSSASIVSDAAVVVSLALPYGDGATRGGVWEFVARHARGRDYHKTMKARLKGLAAFIAVRIPDAAYRVFVDSAPVMERSWAVRAGLGRVGKNGMLIVPGVGPRVILGEIVLGGGALSVPTEEGDGTASLGFSQVCTDCSRCVRACPTGALNEDGTLILTRCLSYLSSNAPGPLPAEYASKMKQMYGCDICTDVCPAVNPDVGCQLESAAANIAGTLNELVELNDVTLQQRLAGTSLYGAGAERLKRNARQLLKKGK